MSLPPRFYLPALTNGECVLGGSEAHHLLHVRRAKVGDVVELFDGQGRFSSAEVLHARRTDVTLLANEPQLDPTPVLPLTIASPLPKPDRARWMIEKLTELAVASFVPLITARSVSSGKPIKADKLAQYVVDACKQSRRNTLLQVAEPVSLRNFAGSVTGLLLVADRDGTPLSGDVGLSATVIVGPEGGLNDDERELLSGLGARSVSFGSHILRVETAAIAAAVLMSGEPA